MTPTTVPLDVTPEAAERIAERGLQPALDRTIAHAVKTVPGIRRVEISLEGPYDTHYEPYLDATAYRDHALWRERNPEVDQYREWLIHTFSPDVLWQLSLDIWPDAP